MISHRLSNPTDPARVVVLGASGFVGSHLVEHLASQGIHTLAIGSSQIDLSRQEAVAELKETIKEDDSVVFISALTPDKGRDIATMMKNLAMGEHVSNFLESSPFAHLVYIGTDAIYPDSVSLVDEDTHCGPNGIHGAMHLARELMLKYALRDKNTPYITLRPSLLYGTGDTHNGYGPNRFLRSAESGQPISLFGEGADKRDHVYIKDLANIIAMCLTHQSEGILNVATGASVSFQSVADVISDLGKDTGLDVKIEHATQGSAVSHRHFDTSACIKAFPGFSYTSLQDGLAETIKSFQSGPVGRN